MKNAVTVLDENTHPAASWQQVRTYVDAAAKFERCKLACQVMAGMELIELKKAYGITQGSRTDLNFPNNLGSSDTNSEAPSSWKEIVAREVGISDQTATNWMRMAEAAKPKLRKLVGPALFEELVSSPISSLSEERSEALKDAVHEITDGKTQLQFMLDLGLAKKPGALPPRPPARKLTPEEEADATQKMAEIRLYDVLTLIQALNHSTDLAEVSDKALNELDDVRIDLGHQIEAVRKARRAAKRR